MSDFSQEVKSGSRTSTLWGILAPLLGIFCLSAPWLPGLGLVLMIGIALILAGAAKLIFSFGSHSFRRGALRFLVGALAIFAGGALVAITGAGLATITLLLAAWFLVDGIYARSRVQSEAGQRLGLDGIQWPDIHCAGRATGALRQVYSQPIMNSVRFDD